MSKKQPDDFEVRTYVAIDPESGDTFGIAEFRGRDLRFGAIINDSLKGFETREEAEAFQKSVGGGGHIVPLTLRPNLA